MNAMQKGCNPTDGFTVTGSDALDVNLTCSNSTRSPPARCGRDWGSAVCSSYPNQAGTLSATDAEGTSLSFGISGGTAGSYSVDSVSYDVSKVGGYGTL